MDIISDNRKAKFESVAAARQEFTVVLENVHDPHNIGAVMRSCDAVGITEIYILYTDERQKDIKLKDLQNTSTGIKKWVDINLYNDLEACFEAIKKKYSKIYATHLNADAVSIHKTDFTQNVALLFGNEHAGLTSEALAKADGNILIPQVGMAQSLNISVACAVTLYEAMRQRIDANLYKESIGPDDTFNQKIFEEYLLKHKEHYLRERLNK